MKDLIARLEAATGPSRELDAEIAAIVCGGKADPSQPGWCIDGPEYMALAYTESLDDARTLVPDGYQYTVGSVPVEGQEPVISAMVNWEPAANGSTEALALTIAALKARSG
jgi:hypothetical protein